MKTRVKIRIFSSFAFMSFLVLGCSAGEDIAHAPIDYADWDTTVDGPLLYEIPGHTMAMRMIYINETGKRLEITDNGGQEVHEYPDGTIILKENYSAEDSTHPAQLTVMNGSFFRVPL